jgi:hypothetical protein
MEKESEKLEFFMPAFEEFKKGDIISEDDNCYCLYQSKIEMLLRNSYNVPHFYSVYSYKEYCTKSSVKIDNTSVETYHSKKIFVEDVLNFENILLQGVYGATVFDDNIEEITQTKEDYESHPKLTFSHDKNVSINSTFGIGYTDGSSLVCSSSGPYTAALAYNRFYEHHSIAANTGFKSSSITNLRTSVAVNTGNNGRSKTMKKNSVAIVNAAVGGEAIALGNNSLAIAYGRDSVAKGAKGNRLVLTEWDENDDNLIGVEMVIVDGETIKENTYYHLKNGKVQPILNIDEYRGLAKGYYQYPIL